MGQFDWCPVHPTDRVPKRVTCRTDIRRLAHGGQRRHPGVTFRWLILNAESVNRRRSFLGRKADGEGWHHGLQRDRPQKCLLACCFAGFIAPLLSTMMNLSLVNIGAEFGAGSHSLAYVNTSFLLSSVIFMVPMAKVGDIYGKKKMFLLGVALIAVASLLAAFSPSFWFLIGCRVVMGAGSAAIVTTSVSMITDVFPITHRGGAIGLQTMCTYIGLAAGPPLGVTLNDVFGWHTCSS